MSGFETLFMVMGIFYIFLATLPTICKTILHVVLIFHKAYRLDWSENNVLEQVLREDS